MRGLVEGKSFQTRARALDHLGREQIADCPTAISELWKNAYDAYARSVELNIFDGSLPVASVIDDGHGMNAEEFVDRWLTVGTESKITAVTTPVRDRHGLRPRPRQGQKGIGRLSCANLGPILLLISKRSKDPFVAALVDWRLFENPFLNLGDIRIPVAEFEGLQEIFDNLPNLVAELAKNLPSDMNNKRNLRLSKAWNEYDQLQTQEYRSSSDNTVATTSKFIERDISTITFEKRHLAHWAVSSGESTHGTALLVLGINHDLRIHLSKKIRDVAARGAKDRFFETLSSFVDPYVDPALANVELTDPQFTYAVQVWRDDEPPIPILGSEKQFDKRQILGMEHQLDGRVNSDGVFVGRVKAFGEWLDDTCEIQPPKDLVIPTRRNLLLGPFELFVASMEFNPINTTHPQAEFRHYRGLAENYSGFMVFRDGLRVLPYGRTDNDFFEIESRRSKHAGREFWNHRQMFGRLAVTRRDNPNLKDKAGREGLLDNRAAKTLKAIVSNILRQSARKYFGSESEVRKVQLPIISTANKRKRAAEARKKLQKKQRRVFRKKLDAFATELPLFAEEVCHYVNTLDIRADVQISKAQKAHEGFGERLSDFRIVEIPKKLGTLKEAYVGYCELMSRVASDVSKLSELIDKSIENRSPVNPLSLLEQQIDRQRKQIDRRIDKWQGQLRRLQSKEYNRFIDIAGERKQIFQAEVKPLIHRFKTRQLSYLETSKKLSELKQHIDEENGNLFIPYIGALESLNEKIDLENLAVYGSDEIGDLREEVERLNSLAQLGIAVEIVGHELESYDDIIGSALRRLPETVKSSSAFGDIEFGYEGLTDQLRFLSPLKLAGQKVSGWIGGLEIEKYVSEFFSITLTRNEISLIATEEFRRFRVYEQRSRLYPVFINLLNNSIYWLGLSEGKDRKIVLGVVGNEVVVSDNGPGVDKEDIEHLFTLFFTRKIRGGRGVGLYLCRANLGAGGHSIRYESSQKNMPLNGANFLISFRGAEFDAK